MTFLNGDHLRILSPVTIDGNMLKLDDSGKAIYKETHLPMTAKKALLLQNSRLPPHLRKKIELVSPDQPVAVTAQNEEIKTRTKVSARTSLKNSLV